LSSGSRDWGFLIVAEEEEQLSPINPYRDSLTLHGAACHACLFAPETSCERGNKYLDRSVLVATVEREKAAFFE
jgi:hypothetical protein